ncbi:TPA: phage tail spike protein [Streptococcus suis]
MIYLKDGNIPLNLAYDDDIVQEANSTYQLSFKFPLTDGKWNLLKREVFLLADDLHGEQEFFIFEVKQAKGYVQVYAKQVATLLHYYSINSVSVDRVPGQTVMTALAGSVKRPCPFTFFSDIMDRHTFNESDVSVLDALVKEKHSILGQWGGDLVRDKYQVKLLKNGGIENESLFMYKKNLSSYEESENINNLKTRLHLKKTIQGQTEGEKDRVLAVTVDSPLINQYSQIYEADIEVNDQDVTDVASLTAYGQRYFGSTLCDLVENSINLDIKGKADVSVKIFDTVSVFHERFDVDLRLKITSYHFGPMSKRLKSIGFGKVSQSFGSTVASMVAGSVDKATGRLSASFERKLQKEIDNANRHFDAEFEKRVEEINDGIEQSKAEAERYADQIKTEISQEFDTFEHEYQATKQSQSQQIADILAKAQANTILATDAKNIGNQAKADAANALSKAIQYKNEAIAEATRLDTVERQATETKLATAKSQAISEATRLVETAKSLLSGQISNISTDLSQTKEAIKLLATRETVDTLTGRVSSAEAMIQVQADQISQRVKTSDFDQAKQRISTAESSITQLGNRITTEISETVAKIPTEIGSINLLDNTDYKKGVTDWIEDGLNRSLQNNYLRLQLLGTLNKRVYKAKDFNHLLTNGETITVSYIAYSNREGVGFSASTYDTMPEKQRVTLNQTPTKYIKTFNLGQSRRLSLFIYGNIGDEVFVKNIQVERGKIASDWRLAPEDFIDEIASVKTITTQTAEGQEQLSTRLSETQGKVSEAETKIRQLVNDVSSKVSQMTFDSLKKTVDSQGTSIIQNQSAIALKAEKNYVDGVKATADSAKSTASDALSKANINAESIKTTKADLQVTSDAVKTKVSQLDFNSATQRLTNAETSIRTQAGQIEQRLTSTQVESAITAKGYQTKIQVDNNIIGRGYITNSALQPYALYTTVQSLVQETSNSFQRTITETKSLIPVDSVNQNLLITSTEIQKSLLLGNEIYPSPTIGNYDSSTIREAISVSPGDTYTFTKISIPNKDNFWRVTYLDSSKNFHSRFPNQSDKFTITIPAGVFYMWVSYPNNSNSKIEKGNKATPYSISVLDTATVTALHSVKDTVDSHTRSIGAVGTAGSILDNVSRVTQTANGLVQEVSGSGGIKSQVSQLNNSWSVQNLNSSGDILSQANLSSALFLLEAAKIRLKGKTLADEIQAIDGKFGTLFVADGTFAKLNANVIDSQAITADKLKVDQAFFNKLMANDAYLKQLFAKTAFITQVQAVTMSASQISGGILTATNGAMQVNLNAGQIMYYTDQAALKRVLTGYPTQFVKFATGTVTGKGTAGVTVIGSNRWNSESSNDGGFVGIRAWNGSNIDQIDVVGDTVRLASSTFESADGWTVNTLPGKLDIDAFNADHRASSKIKVGDVWLWKNATTYSSMRDTINLIIDNLQLLHNNKSTERAYSYTLPAKV